MKRRENDYSIFLAIIAIWVMVAGLVILFHHAIIVSILLRNLVYLQIVFVLVLL
jgi:hypothetical protein